MNRTFFTMTACLAAAAASAMAQTVVEGGGRAGAVIRFQPDQSNFQQVGVMGVGVPVMAGRGGRGAVVTGSPFSAVEVTKTVQTLSDGTELENSDSTVFYRDSQGRTRTEASAKHGGMISIVDPVAGYRIQLNPAEKTANRIAMPDTLPRVVLGARGGTMMPDAVVADGGSVGGVLARVSEGMGTVTADTVARAKAGVTNLPNHTNEDLGLQTQNGVLAQGTRDTMTIPQGQIGNNRDIHVTNERWFSKDLGMLVKTVNTDPRFGVTTYDLTNILQAAPDAALFQIPAGYTITESAGRGGRAGGR